MTLKQEIIDLMARGMGEQEFGADRWSIQPEFTQDFYRSQAEAALQALENAGWVVAPRRSVAVAHEAMKVLYPIAVEILAEDQLSAGARVLAEETEA